MNRQTTLTNTLFIKLSPNPHLQHDTSPTPRTPPSPLLGPAQPQTTVQTNLSARQLARLLDTFGIQAVMDAGGRQAAPPPGKLEVALKGIEPAEGPAFLEIEGPEKSKKTKKNKKKKKSATVPSHFSSSSSPSASASSSASPSSSVSVLPPASDSDPGPSSIPLCAAPICLLDCGKAHSLPAHCAGLTNDPALPVVAARAAATLSRPMALPDPAQMSEEEIKADIRRVFGSLSVQQAQVAAYLWHLARVEVERMRIKGLVPRDTLVRADGPAGFMKDVMTPQNWGSLQGASIGCRCRARCKGKHRAM